MNMRDSSGVHKFSSGIQLRPALKNLLFWITLGVLISLVSYHSYYYIGFSVGGIQVLKFREN